MEKQYEYLKSNANECALFLKVNNEFPLKKPCDLVLVGSGARKTIKGGTGSGDIVCNNFKNIEIVLTERGFNITSTKWLDQYDKFRESTKNQYIRDCKRKAKEAHVMPLVYSIGFFEEEKEYQFSCDYDGNACIYVLARNSGEGQDRRNIKGDVKLTDKEIADILYLNKKHKKFMLVLNVGGVIDLGPVLEVSNILLLSQLGGVTSEVLADILLGKTNPSGKLTTTWAKPEDYPCFNEFGGRDDTYYKEGIYVGYRYFNTVNKNVYFPFGFGLSYTDFNYEVLDIKQDKFNFNIKVNVKNIGKYTGKEVVQIYVTRPNQLLDNPYVELCAYQKTKELKPEEEQILELNVDVLKLFNYDAKRALNILQNGEYIFRIGTSSINLKNIFKCVLEKELIIEKLNNKCCNVDFEDLKLDRIVENLEELKKFIFPNEYETKKIEYKKDEYINSYISKLSNKQLAYICVGHHKSGIAAMIGASCEHVVGGAGETVLKIKEIDKSLTMADGPAGIRIANQYVKNYKGIYITGTDPMTEQMTCFLPHILRPLLKPKKNIKGTCYFQNTTAIPIATALAQSFNTEFVFNCASIIAKEMQEYKIDLWLAPAINIHRNILCGRNFEYYSEDPYLSGMIASAMIKGVEQYDKLGVTIKHFACNNQETNRNNNNSHVSERALREIYLKGFEMCIKEANPKAIMTSYNLINGIHTSEHYELINDILRCEWNYQGLVMSDWIKSGRSFCKKSYYLAPYASNNILAGNDLTMPGCKKDFKDIMKSLKKHKLTRDDLLHSASRIYRAILRQKD